MIRVATVLGAPTLLLALALGACAAPASYDGLTGGGPSASTEDPLVVAPRPVAPISVSFIASARPRLRWDLGATEGGTLTGAVVEMARTRAFDKDVKRFPATGSELVVPEDLALGVWFWRLKGATATTYGTTTSPVWEMVVRGPAAHGSSDLPSRSMVDVDGDGEPDLLVSGMGVSLDGYAGMPPASSGSGGVTTRVAPTKAGAGAGSSVPSAPVLMYYAGDPVRGFAGGPADGDFYALGTTPYEGAISIGGGTDLNGDGLTDIIESGMVSASLSGERFFSPSVLYASGKHDVPIDWDHWSQLYVGDSIVQPQVHEAADVDGDGYGDAVIGVAGMSFLVIGSVPKLSNLPALMPIYPSSAGIVSASEPARVAMAGFDANGDGLGDMIFSLADSYEPSARAFAAAGSRSVRVGDPRPIDAPDAKLATAFAAGDFNGDGLDDIAITTPVGDASRVCLWFGSRDKLVVQGPCLPTPTGTTVFGASLTAADLEGDGTDELLATGQEAGVEIVHALRLDGSTLTRTKIATGLGVRLTTIWPGRPGKARWAAVAADGSSVGVFEGTTLKTTMLPPDGIVRGFGRGLR